MMRYKIFLALIILFSAGPLLAAGRLMTIKGSADQLRDGDSVFMSLSPFTGRLDEIRQDYITVVRKNTFSIQIPGLDKPQYLNILFHYRGKLVSNFFVMFPRDDLNFAISTNGMQFNGPSARRFEAQVALHDIAAAYSKRPYLHFSPETMRLIYNRIDSCTSSSLEYLETNKTAIGMLAFRFLSANEKAKSMYFKIERMTSAGLNKSAESQKELCDAFRKYGKPFNSYPSYSLFEKSGKPTAGLSADVIYEQYLVDSCIFKQRKLSVHDLYKYESAHFSGEIREQLVTSLFIIKRNSPELRSADVSDALSYVNTPKFRDVLDKIRITNTIGAKAPEFTLSDADKRPVSLSDFKGKVVLLDFWFTGCWACKAMAPVLKRLEEQYQGRPVVFITISIDRKREQWLETLKTNAYTSPLSVNLFTEGQGNQHQVMRDYDVSGCPTYILIDKNGKIAPNPGREEAEISRLIDKYL